MITDNTKKVLVAISGGVDSAVCASLLKEQGYYVEGAIMALSENTDIDGAKAVCDFLGIKLHVLDLQKEFEQKVINHFCDRYLKNKTPNPCITCNKTIKFGAFLKEADKLGFKYIATGHYARIIFENGTFLLKKSLCSEKDQSYMLYTLTRDVLSRVIFPLGEMKSKDEVRKYAEKAGLPVFQKPDSQDICFIPDGDYAKYILKKTDIKIKCGDFINREGEILGKHKGLIHYTVGQRRGLNISLGKRAFVVEKNLSDNTVIIGEESDLYSSCLDCKDINFINPVFLPLKVQASTRYKKAPSDAVISQNDDGGLLCEFSSPQKFISPGQSVVFYDNDIVLGGGIIC